MMVGLGETRDEILETMRDLRSVDCDLLTIGQYLRPTKNHHPLIRFYSPADFNDFRDAGLAMGFRHVRFRAIGAEFVPRRHPARGLTGRTGPCRRARLVIHPG